MDAIDIHIHHPWRDPDAERPDVALKALKEHAKRNGIQKVLLLTLALGTEPEELRTRNNGTLALLREDPQFYLGACYLSPEHKPEFIKEEARRCMSQGMVAIKQHMDLVADHPRQDPISEVAAELDVPIVFHAWYKMAQKYSNESNAAHIAALARRHPDTKYVMAHLSGNGRRGVQDIADLGNVWIDTSGGFSESEMVEYAVRILGSERVVYGSDYTVGRDYAAQLGRVLGSRLDSRDKQRLLWENASQLLKLA